MDAPTEVTRWDGRTYCGISIALSITFKLMLYGEGRHHWTFEYALLEKNMHLEVCFLRTICLSLLFSLLIMTQMPHFRALSHGNCWTAGSTVITATRSVRSCDFSGFLILRAQVVDWWHIAPSIPPPPIKKNPKKQKASVFALPACQSECFN